MDEIIIHSATDGGIKTLVATASADREPGDVQEINGLVCVAYAEIANGEDGVFIYQGERVRAPAAGAFNAGNKAYWDDSTKTVTETSTDNTACGVFTSSGADGDDADFELDNSPNL